MTMSRARRKKQPDTISDESKEIIVHLSGYGRDGEAFGIHNGRTVYANYGIPGETVRILIRREDDTELSGEVIEIIKESEHRRAPPCPHFGECGGCQLQHINYPFQLELKHRVVTEKIESIGHILGAKIMPTLPSQKEWNYRNHVRFTITREGKAGFNHRYTHKFVPVDNCHIADNWINTAKEALEKGAGGNHQFALRYGVNSGDSLILPALPNNDAGYETGQKFHTEKLYEIPFRVSAASFFQVNTPQAERIIDLVREGLELQGTDVIVDAYAGVGTFAALLAPFVKKVVAIEESRAAILDAKQNLEQWPHIEIVEAKTEKALAEISAPIDGVILDPPRSGCDPAVLDTLESTRPRRIVYVSCDPETLARDLHQLVLNGFHLVNLQPIDMFPQTHHIETVATLSRMTQKDVLLASTSPRRRELISHLGLSIQTIVPNIDEETISTSGSPEEQAIEIAVAKAYSIAQDAKVGKIVSGDTMVILDDQIIGKPQNEKDAFSILQRLRNREHRVVTGIAVIDAQGEQVAIDAAVTTVKMRNYSDSEIEASIASGYAMDKAGAYAIQDTEFNFVSGFDGCPSNVVGLPLCKLARLLEQQGTRIRSIEQRSAEDNCSLCHSHYKTTS